MKTKSGRILSGKRWRVNEAASEFHVDDETLSKRLKVLGIDAASDGAFSTAEICAAVFGDIHAARLRLINEQADEKALENARTRGDLISAEDAFLAFSNVCFAIRRVILTSALTNDEKDQILMEIVSFDTKQFTDMLQFQANPTAK
jgi:phage terminase Nu1 subunit (DNA packaging protein)